MNRITREGLIVCVIALSIVACFSSVAHYVKVYEQNELNAALACDAAGNQWREVSDNQFACLTNQGN